MELIVAAVGAVALLFYYRKKQAETQGSSEPPPETEPDDPSGVKPPSIKGQYSRALFWAHKTGAGFVLVGYCKVVKQGSPDTAQYWFRSPIMIDPGLIAPGVEPQSPGYFVGMDFFLRLGTELEPVGNAAGAYQILAPLNWGGGDGGPFNDDVLARMILRGGGGKTQDQAVAEMRARYAGERKNVSVGRSWPFASSQLFRTRSGAFGAYFYPVLVELG